MEHRFLYNAAPFEVLDDDPLHQCGGNSGVPHAIGVDDYYRPTLANAQARGFAPLHAGRAEKEIFPLEE